jgi:hypothetical protein
VQDVQKMYNQEELKKPVDLLISGSCFGSTIPSPCKFKKEGIFTGTKHITPIYVTQNNTMAPKVHKIMIKNLFITILLSPIPLKLEVKVGVNI